MIAIRRSSVAFATDSVAQAVRRSISASARLEASVAAQPCTGAGLDLAQLYPAIFSAPRQPSMNAAYVRAMSGALTATGAFVGGGAVALSVRASASRSGRRRSAVSRAGTIPRTAG